MGGSDIAAEIVLIRQLQARYNLAGDRLRLDELALTFLPNGVLETGRAAFEGREAIVAGLQGASGGGEDTPASAVPLTFVRHHLTTCHIDLMRSDEAAGRTYFHVHTDIGSDHMGVYVDRFRKVDGAWFFAHRRARTDWVAENSLFPGAYAAHRERLAAKLAAHRG